MKPILLAAFLLSFTCLGNGQTTSRSKTSLLYPPYNNLPTVEGYFAGADNVRLFYRMVGNGKATVVFLHGGPGSGIEDGALDLEGIADRGFRYVEMNERAAAIRNSCRTNRSSALIIMCGTWKHCGSISSLKR